MCKDHIWFERDQFRGAFANFVKVVRSPARLDLNVLANQPTKFLEFLLEGLHLNLKFHIGGACGKENANMPDTIGLLGTRPKRPSGRNSNSFNEIAASHYLLQGPGSDIVAGQTSRSEGAGAMDVHVRFGSKADIAARPRHVRFTPES